MSICGTLFISGGGLLLSESNLHFKFLVSVVTLSSLFGLIGFGLSIKLHHEENKKKHKLKSSEMTNILQKIEESLVETES